MKPPEEKERAEGIDEQHKPKWKSEELEGSWGRLHSGHDSFTRTALSQSGGRGGVKEWADVRPRWDRRPYGPWGTSKVLVTKEASALPSSSHQTPLGTVFLPDSCWNVLPVHKHVCCTSWSPKMLCNWACSLNTYERFCLLLLFMLASAPP